MISLWIGFNPWYVGGGVKRARPINRSILRAGFNPWYVGGGVKRLTKIAFREAAESSFNPWYVGGGVKSQNGCRGRRES